MSPMRKLQKTLPCPGNIVGGAKRHPTTLPGHRSGFQLLPRRRRGKGGRGGLSWPSFWPFCVIVGLWCVGGGWMCCQSSETKKYPINRGLQGIGGGVGVVEGRRVHRIGCWGGVVDTEVGVVIVSSPEYTKVKKKPCKHRFTGGY